MGPASERENAAERERSLNTSRLLIFARWEQDRLVRGTMIGVWDADTGQRAD